MKPKLIICHLLNYVCQMDGLDGIEFIINDMNALNYDDVHNHNFIVDQLHYAFAVYKKQRLDESYELAWRAGYIIPNNDPNKEELLITKMKQYPNEDIILISPPILTLWISIQSERNCVCIYEQDELG